MAWDSSRPVPWRRIAMWMGIYVVVMLGVSVLSNRSGDVRSSIAAVVIGSLIAAVLLVVLTKLGWKLPMLMSRQEAADLRVERMAARNAARAARKGQTVAAPSGAERARVAPTRRTTTGPSQHPRRTTKTRKR